MILDIPYVADWNKIVQKKQDLINKSNIKENKTCFNYDYAIGDKVSISYDGIRQKLTPCREGPFEIIQVFTNGMVKIQCGPLYEIINIQQLTPYIE